MIARHYSSLLVLTAHFPEFSSIFPHHQECRKWRKWRVRTSNDEQWRDIIDIHKVRCISGPIKKIWIKNLVWVRKTNDFWRFGEKSPPNVFHRKSARAFSKPSFSELRRRFPFKSFLLDQYMFGLAETMILESAEGFLSDRRRVFFAHIEKCHIWPYMAKGKIGPKKLDFAQVGAASWSVGMGAFCAPK